MALAGSLGLMIIVAVAVLTYLLITFREETAEKTYSVIRVVYAVPFVVFLAVTIFVFAGSGNPALISFAAIMVFFAVLWLVLDYYSPYRAARRNF